jgi:hypothetical protein
MSIDQERANRIANILGVRGGTNGVRAQSTATTETERLAAEKMNELFDVVFPHVKQIQERQSLEEHGLTFLEEIVQALR